LARDLIRDYPDCSLAYYHYGAALVELRRYEEAKSALQESIKHCREDKLHTRYAQMGHLYEGKGDLEEALEWYKKCIELEPQDAGYHIYAGGTLVRQGKLKEAEECYRVAIECPEGCVDEAYLNLGYVVSAQERFAEALEYSEKALEIDPEYEKAKWGLEDMKAALDYLQKKDRDSDAVGDVHLDWWW
jgi:tetratricopeptide (TPR) repeat protein